MSAGISAIASLSPIVASQFIFSSRRANRGLEALDTNPLNAVMNFDIATAQGVKGSSAALDAARATSAELEQAAQGIDDVVKSVANSSKLAKGVSKVVDFTARNINPVICATSAVKAVTAEKGKKLETAADETGRLGTMFAFEGAYKALAGMPRYERVNGKLVSKPVDSILYRDIDWVRKGADAFTKWCNETALFNKKLPLNFLPGTLKGLGFVAASIAGYKLGSCITKELGINQDYNRQQQIAEKDAAKQPATA